MGAVLSDAALIELTRMGALDMSAPQSKMMNLLKKLRGSSKPSTETGEKKMRMLKRIPKILKYIPGKFQDLRAWFLVMQYWLAGSEANVESMVKFLLSRYCRIEGWRDCETEAPKEYPDVGLYHPDVPEKLTLAVKDLPEIRDSKATIGLLMLRSYVLSNDTAHYDEVIRVCEKRGLKVIPAFAGGLDARPAVEKYFIDSSGVKVDAILSLT